jgi:hypothetical protein
MTKTKTLSVLMALAFAASLGACKKDKKESTEDPSAKPAPTEGTAEGTAEMAQPKDEMDPTEGAEGAEGAEAEGAEGAEIADIGGLQANAVPAQSVEGLEGVAQFSLGDDNEGCAQYGKDIAAFFGTFQTEFQELEANFTPDAAGVAAMRKFSSFLKKGVGEMTELNVAGDNLKAAHLEFVGTLADLAGGFDDLAGAIEVQDQNKAQGAATRVQNAVNNFKTSLNKLVAICGG